MDKTTLIALLKKWKLQTASIAELEELRAYVREEANRENIIQILTQYAMETNELQPYDEARFDPILQNILDADRTGRVIQMKQRKRARIRWVAAASIIIIAAAVVGVLTNNHNNNKPGVTVAADVPAPTNSRAVITLANGSKVYLDSAGNGILAQENNVNVVRNEDGEIIYNTVNASTPLSMTYNTLYNPRGSKVISLTLSDGTKVWLNSESSLRYPASFAPSAVNREVEITGEAYFEVAKMSTPGLRPPPPGGDKASNAGGVRMPFIVKKGDVSVTVLGTHFNVNAYDDEESLKVTLLEGSVKVASLRSQDAKVIKPGQQAVLNQANPSSLRGTKQPQIEVQTNVNIEETMAWKNGTFNYSNADLPTIMRQMARWYDVEVEYKDKITDRYTVDVPRNVPVSQLFKFIEMSGGVKFEIKDKKIIVSK